MNFHAIMPFYRQHLVVDLINEFTPMDLIWHPVCDPVDIRAFNDINLQWIKPLLCKPLRIPGDQCYRKINDFIKAGDIVDDDYYGFVHDDDMYVPGFIDKIKQQTAKIIFFSMSRGEFFPPDDDSPYKWPPVPIILNKPDDIQIGCIDMCQMIVKGEILKQTKFGNNSPCDDGIYAVRLRERFPDDFIIMPEIGINFNWFQPGRYRK